MQNSNLISHITKYWSSFILFESGFFLKVEFEEDLDPNKQYILCSNHVSTIDIPIITSIMPPPIMYIGKQELSRIPIFGYFYKHHCITIDRNNLKDSYNALNQAGEKINQGFNICIFPEGGIPISSIFLKKFKNGAFKIICGKRRGYYSNYFGRQ